MIPKLQILEIEKSYESENYNKKIIFKNNDKKLEINLKYFDKTNKTEKIKIKQNTLIIVLDGLISVDIYQNDSSDNYKKINMYSFMGISLPTNTFHKLNYTKSTFIIEFLDYKTDNDIENLKKDIIL